MALSRESKRSPLVAGVPCALLAALGLAAFAPAHAATTANQITNCQKVIDGRDLGPLSKNKGVDLGDAKITVCDTQIVAQRAHGTSLDFDDSTWTFTGDVHVHLGEQQAQLTSDQAVVKFRNKEVESVTFRGKPAEFEQKLPKSDDLTRGHANNIVYQSQAGTISLEDDVWLKGSGKEFKGQSLVYDIRNAEVSNTSGERGGQRIHITIDPTAAKDPKKKDEDKKPPAPTPP